MKPSDRDLFRLDAGGNGCDAIAIPTSTLRSAATTARGVRSWSLHGRATTCPCGCGSLMKFPQ